MRVTKHAQDERGWPAPSALPLFPASSGERREAPPPLRLRRTGELRHQGPMRQVQRRPRTYPSAMQRPSAGHSTKAARLDTSLGDRDNLHEFAASLSGRGRPPGRVYQRDTLRRFAQDRTAPAHARARRNSSGVPSPFMLSTLACSRKTPAPRHSWQPLQSRRSGSRRREGPCVPAPFWCSVLRWRRPSACAAGASGA